MDNLTKKQCEIVNGSLLGDGTIWNNFVDKNCKLTFSQSKYDKYGVDKISYVLWFQKEFQNTGCSYKEHSKLPTGILKECGKQKVYHSYAFYTNVNKLWNKYEKQWYIPIEHRWYKRKKVVPNNIKLTPLTLCVWHMDDGSVNPKDANVELNTQGFTRSEVNFLIERLGVDLGIKASEKTSSRKNQFKIYIGRKHYFDFIEMIKPHVKWDCFVYKLNTSTYNKKTQIGQHHSRSKLTEDKVRKIFDLRESGLLHREIAAEMGVSTSCITVLLNGDRWSHMNLSKSSVRKPRITKEQKIEIFKLRKGGLSQPKIAETLNVNQSTVSRILRHEKNTYN